MRQVIVRSSTPLMRWSGKRSHWHRAVAASVLCAPIAALPGCWVIPPKVLTTPGNPVPVRTLSVGAAGRAHSAARGIHPYDAAVHDQGAQRAMGGGDRLREKRRGLDSCSKGRWRFRHMLDQRT